VLLRSLHGVVERFEVLVCKTTEVELFRGLNDLLNEQRLLEHEHVDDFEEVIALRLSLVLLAQSMRVRES
jgi:hypothetical protein